MSVPRWLVLARKELGTLEGPGNTNNPKVVGYYKDAGHGEIKDDTVPWCAAFVGAMLQRADITPSQSLGARSYENWGIRLANPILGCIGVKRRAGGQPWQGHVGFVVAANPTTIWLLGGNQDDSVSIAGFSRWQFTAWRWPDEPIPADLDPLPTTYAKAAHGVTEA